VVHHEPLTFRSVAALAGVKLLVLAAVADHTVVASVPWQFPTSRSTYRIDSSQVIERRCGMVVREDLALAVTPVPDRSGCRIMVRQLPHD